MFCPKCGSKSEENALFCSNCGTKIDDDGDQQTFDSSENKTAAFDTDEKEVFKEIMYLQWNKGKITGNPPKILYFTNRNIYMTEGIIFMSPDGRGFDAISEVQKEIKREKKALHMDFHELAASEDVIIIPYEKIINITLPKKKKMFRTPSLSIETTTETYNFYFLKWDDHEYKDKVVRYLDTIPPLFGDKVTIK